jgi:hypothetical protein
MIMRRTFLSSIWQVFLNYDFETKVSELERKKRSLKRASCVRYFIVRTLEFSFFDLDKHICVISEYTYSSE